MALYLYPVLFTLGLLLVLVTEIWWRLRARRLSAEDPPSAQEIEEVRELRRPGVIHLGGRESAAARHFETAAPHSQRSRHGGGHGLKAHPPILTSRWRDNRSSH